MQKNLHPHLTYMFETARYVPHQGSEQMVEDEVNGYYWSPHMTYSHQGLVHDIYPALLG